MPRLSTQHQPAQAMMSWSWKSAANGALRNVMKPSAISAQYTQLKARCTWGTNSLASLWLVTSRGTNLRAASPREDWWHFPTHPPQCLDTGWRFNLSSKPKTTHQPPKRQKRPPFSTTTTKRRNRFRLTLFPGRKISTVSCRWLPKLPKVPRRHEVNFFASTVMRCVEWQSLGFVGPCNPKAHQF